MKIREVLHSPPIGKKISVSGWIRTVRAQKEFSFVEINDGSTLKNLQAILDSHLDSYEENLKRLSVGASVTLKGEIVESPGKNQQVELKVHKVHIWGEASPETYPLQKKRHSFEFLRTLAHLRPRTNTQGAILRMRSHMAFATHKFFQERGFFYVHTPIVTGSDCEGGGELFRVTTLQKPNEADTEDFFGKKAYLTVSGQLEAESLALALSDVYTFGPTFRAENSNTSRHLAEFWMIEPEMAFADLEADKECAESYLKYCIRYALEHCREDLEFFDRFIENGLIQRLELVEKAPFANVSYTEAIALLEKAPKSFDFPVKWGIDLQSEHERYLVDLFQRPLIVQDYPEAIKAFYMRRNEDGKTVAAMDILVPKIGEIIGGSQREERKTLLEEKMERAKIDKKELWWYLELREFGSTPHAGFGLGFERLLLFMSGMENIRDVIPFPRFPGHVEF